MAGGPPRGSMSQEIVFYTKEWTKEIDRVFIHALTQQTTEGNIVFNGKPNRSSLLYCKALVNNQFGKSFDYDFFVDRFNKLYKRFTVFNWIINQPGVIHYPLDHSLDCDDAAWSAICRVNKFFV